MPFKNIGEKRPTMAQQMCEMGRSAMEMLVERIESPIPEPESEQGRVVVLEAELRVRNSTAPPASNPVL